MRFEVVARASDRELVRTLAKKLAEGNQDAQRIRETLSAPGEKYVPKKGGIIEALLASPIVSSGIVFKRSNDKARRVKF